jgi:hypothetical protein
MWRDLGRLVRLDPRSFRREFDRIYHDCRDIKTLWQLGGATNDYLRANPDAMAVPAELPRRLLASHHLHARIVGLKLLNRSDVPDAELIATIVRALNRRDGNESCGGLYELGQLLDRRDALDLDSSLVHALRAALSPLVDDNEPTHAAASRLLHILNSQSES